MTAAPVESGAWSRGRLWAGIVVVGLAQAGLIFWLGRGEPSPAAPKPGPGVCLPPAGQYEFPRPASPALFALPNRHGFSGPAWLEVTGIQPPVLEYADPPRWLGMQEARLGAAFSEFVRTNTTAPVEVVRHVEPMLDSAAVYPSPDLAPVRSTLRIEGDLAGRRLLSPVNLPGVEASDQILSPTEVQVDVAADGRVFSAELWKSAAASQASSPATLRADQLAMDFSWSARFQPLPATGRPNVPGAGLARGKLVFQWLAVPPAAADPTPITPASAPSPP